MISRKAKAGRNAVVASLLFLGILVLINFLMAKNFFRLDLTENREYTVSEATKTILGRMDDIVNIKVYFSRDLPSYLATLRSEVEDMLEEFRAYSKGNLVIDFEDPTKDPETENRVRRLGVPQVQLDVIKSDSRSIQNAFLGMAILYEDRNEVIPVISSTANLEYELAQGIIKVMEKERKVVGFLTGHGEPDLSQAYDAVRQEAEKQYTVQRVDLQGGRQKVPQQVTALVIAGPNGINEREKYLIDQYLMGGGKLIVLEDAIQLVEGALQARPVRSGLENLLPFYGAKVEEDQILDSRCAVAGFSQGFFRYMIPYRYWPRVLKDGLNPENPIVSRMESLIFPWVSSISESELKPETVQFTRLAWTSNQSWPITGPFNLNPQQEFAPPPDKLKSYTVAAALTGNFKSYFADKEVPPVPADTTSAIQAPADEPKIAESPATQIILIGSSQIANNNFLSQFPANLTFMLNTIDWVALGNELIAIRSREVSDRPLNPEILKDEAEAKRNTIKFAGTFGMPILLTVYGMLRWLARRREKQAFEDSLQGAGQSELDVTVSAN
jgi:gliding-associated putative ABC transporter substrate-binding component GldG